jgi:hypothetical protein
MTSLKRAGVVAQCDKLVGRILLGDNTCGVAVMLRKIRFQYAVFWILTGQLCIYVCSWPYLNTVPTYTKFDSRRNWRNVTIALRQGLSVIMSDENKWTNNWDNMSGLCPETWNRNITKKVTTTRYLHCGYTQSQLADKGNILGVCLTL